MWNNISEHTYIMMNGDYVLGVKKKFFVSTNIAKKIR